MSLPLPGPLPVVPAHLRRPQRMRDDEGARGVPPGRRVLAPFDPERVPAAELPLWLALRDVLDPEIPVSIVDLGLVYDVRRAGGRVVVDLTFTALGCPCMAFIRADIEERLRAEPGVAEVEIREVWSPPWSRERMTATARETMRRLGVAT